MSGKVIRLGGGSGFWGDSSEGPRQLVLSGEIDYLVMDYLAEITMSLLARAKAKNPAHGFAPDFVTQVLKPLGKEIEKRGIKVIANAGGVNPLACRNALVKEIEAQGLKLKVAAVVGDDAVPVFEEVRREGVREMWTGAEPPKTIVSANAYLGALPIAEALKAGADIVVTGRCVDSAIALGPLIHEFGWKPDQFDLLAAGSLAGHVIECGPQATGGIFTDWRDVADSWDNIGYPIAECTADGAMIITKAKDTGGMVTTMTVAEQITYETGDPENYVLPDVICDLSHVTVEQVGKDRVKVAGVRGKAPTSTYKVSATYPDGFRAIANLMVNGIDAVDKARAVAASILKRCRRIYEREGLGDFADVNVEVLGAEATYGPHGQASKVRETILKIGVHHYDKRAVEIFSREIAPASTGTGQGIAGVASGRPPVQPVLRLYSFLLEKNRLKPEVDFNGRRIAVNIPTQGQAITNAAPRDEKYPAVNGGESVTVPLIKIAYGRSGDKGDVSNVVIMARKPEFLPAIAQQLTAEAVATYMAHLAKGEVVRYPWPGLHGFNFLLHEALGGGGVGSIRYDAQGKAHAQMLMDFPVTVPKAWVA
ncbi:MAG: DUF1446 domain-containing protein [Rhodospirillaceae bacterium]|nr:DUF1446 domain-containing protein [Rhodospirillaceae bacterium]